MSAPDGWVRGELAAVEAAGLRRTLTELEGPPGPTMSLSGRRVIVLGSNNYLDLAGHPRVVEGAVEAARRYGAGAGASRLVTGANRLQAELEARLAALVGAESALLFSSGYLANVAAIPALVGAGDEVFSDVLNHASIIDGCRLSGARVSVYPHGDLAALEGLLRASRARRRLIASDTLFSMEGDAAPVAGIASLAAAHGAMTLLDESHAVGVLGTGGGGLARSAGDGRPGASSPAWPDSGPVSDRLAGAAQPTLLMGTLSKAIGAGGAARDPDRPTLVMGTLSKALGSAGGFVAGGAALVDLLRHRARGFVFDTAPAPAALGAALAALDVIAAEPDRRVRLLRLTRRLRDRLEEAGLRLLPGPGAIVPLIVGEPGPAMAIARRLREAGVLAPAIRPPSVPAGTSRLRLTVSAGFDEAQVDEAAAAIAAAARAEGLLATLAG